MADLALVVQFDEGSDRIGDRDLRIGAMELVQGDLRELKPAQAAVAGGTKVLGSTVRGPLVGTRPLSPPLVAITRSSGYGESASAMNDSLTPGPYESAVSMKLTPSSTGGGAR